VSAPELGRNSVLPPPEVDKPKLNLAHIGEATVPSLAAEVDDCGESEGKLKAPSFSSSGARKAVEQMFDNPYHIMFVQRNDEAIH
jgi:hypothetical protein